MQIKIFLEEDLTHTYHRQGQIPTSWFQEWLSRAVEFTAVQLDIAVAEEEDEGAKSNEPPPASPANHSQPSDDPDSSFLLITTYAHRVRQPNSTASLL